MLRNMITFIAPAFNEPIERRPLIASLLKQTNPNWEVIVYHNGPNPEFGQWVESFKDERILYKESPTNTGAWGCHNRQDALDYYTKGLFVIQTSIQDTYDSSIVEEILKLFDFDILIWDSYNHLTGPEPLICEMTPGRIDWGNACVRTDLARRAGILYPQEFAADWLFFKTILDVHPLVYIRKIDRILTNHN